MPKFIVGRAYLVKRDLLNRRGKVLIPSKSIIKVMLMQNAYVVVQFGDKKKTVDPYDLNQAVK